MDKEKKDLFKVGTLFLMVVGVLFVYMVFWGPWSESTNYPTHTINVSAVGKAVATPDIAKVSFAVVSEGSNTQQIADDNNKKISSAIDFLTSQGVDKKDIKTTDYSLVPVYSQPSTVSSGQSFAPVINHYSISQTVEVKVREFAKVSQIMAKLTELGINRINSLVFDIDNPETARAEARAQAIKEAQDKAHQMAKAADFKLGKLVNVSDYMDSPMPYMESAVKMADGMGGGMVSAPRIEPGTRDVSVTVNLTYEIK